MNNAWIELKTAPQALLDHLGTPKANLAFQSTQHSLEEIHRLPLGATQGDLRPLQVLETT
jgi:hypothetical protein